MVFSDIDKCLFDDAKQLLVHLCVCFPNLLLCYQNIAGIDICSIKALRIVKNRFVLLLSDVLDDIVDTAFKFAVIVRASF